MNTFPKNDPNWEDYLVEALDGDDNKGWAIQTQGGWWLHLGHECEVRPTVGMTARFYPRALGSAVRGLFLDGRKCWYRTDAEERDHRDIQSYGADAANMLKRWDEGRSVFTVEMGGLGPGYEQCIHVTMFEILRWLIAEKPDFGALEKDDAAWRALRDRMDAAIFAIPEMKEMGHSGAQFGAAVNLAIRFYRQGPRAVLTSPKIQDRKIQVSRDWPKAPSPPQSVTGVDARGGQPIPSDGTESAATPISAGTEKE